MYGINNYLKNFNSSMIKSVLDIGCNVFGVILVNFVIWILFYMSMSSV